MIYDGNCLTCDAKQVSKAMKDELLCYAHFTFPIVLYGHICTAIDLPLLQEFVALEKTLQTIVSRAEERKHGRAKGFTSVFKSSQFMNNWKLKESFDILMRFPGN